MSNTELLTFPIRTLIPSQFMATLSFRGSGQSHEAILDSSSSCSPSNRSEKTCGLYLHKSSLAGLQGGTKSLPMAPKCCRPSKRLCLRFPRITTRRPNVEELMTNVTSSRSRVRLQGCMTSPVACRAPTPPPAQIQKLLPRMTPHSLHKKQGINQVTSPGC